MEIKTSSKAWRELPSDRLYAQDAKNGSPLAHRAGLVATLFGPILGVRPTATTEFEHRVESLTDSYLAGGVHDELKGLQTNSLLKGARAAAVSAASVGGTVYLGSSGWIGAAVATGMVGIVAAVAAYGSFKDAHEYQTLARKTESLGTQSADALVLCDQPARTSRRYP